MKKLIMAVAMMMPALGFAHDEGHGPKLDDAGNYGGMISAVVAKSDASKGSKAELIYRAELVRLAEGKVEVYLYKKEKDEKGKLIPLDLKAFDKRGTASLGAKVKGKWKDSEFKIELKDKTFQGTMPKVEAKPYNIDVTLKADGKELLSAFDNLD